MEYRSIHGSEWEQAERLNSIAYWYKTDVNRMKNDPEMTEDRIMQRYADVRAAVDDDGKLCAKIEIHPYHVFFDGNRCGMGGIGGVASRPECRRGGHIRKLMENALEEMNDREMTFSYLYPFSFFFYGKFGYDPLASYHVLTAPVEPLLKLGMPCSIEQYHPGMDVRPYYSVYAEFARQRNMMVDRTENSWAWRFRDDPEEKLAYYWLTRREDGTPNGYLYYTDGKDGCINVRELIWNDTKALETIMAFLGKFSENRDKVTMRCMPGFLPEAFWPNLWQVECHLHHCGMNRVINARRAFEMMKKPWFPGECVVEVSDQTAPWNTGRWLIEWGEGESRVARTEKAADLVLNANSMNALILGRLTPSEAGLLKTVELHSNERMLDALFCRKDACILDSF